MSAAAATWDEIQALRRARPRSQLLRGTVAIFGLAVLAVWLSGEIQVGDLLTERRRQNLERFLTVEVVPFPMRQEGGASFTVFWAWVSGIWSDRGAAATLSTLWLALAAIVMAAGFGTLISPLAARTLAAPQPYLLEDRDGRGPWNLVSGGARLLCSGMRAMPEYVLAFFLVNLLPFTAWPAVLALALHNGGILGRLYGDTIENLDPRPLRAWSMLGSRRATLASLAAIPSAVPRYLLYFFYRFETCVREATVLGMLGIASLGSEVVEVRAAHFYDELILLIAFGVGIVLLGDLASHLARGWIRRAR